MNAVIEADPGGCGAEIKRALLGFLLYNLPLMITLVVLAGWGGQDLGGRGIRSYSLMLYASIYFFGILICIGLILRFRWWGVVLAPAIGILTLVLV